VRLARAFGCSFDLDADVQSGKLAVTRAFGDFRIFSGYAGDPTP